MSARVRLASKSAPKPRDDSATEWKHIRARRHDRGRRERMQVFIQRDPSGDYWHNHGGWVGTRELATVYAGVVEALDTCISNYLATADIVLVFGHRHARDPFEPQTHRVTASQATASLRNDRSGGPGPP